MNEFKQVYFLEKELSKEAYSVLKKASFKFYQKENEPNYYYVIMLENSKPINLYELYNVENWLESWIDEDGKVKVSKKDIRRTLIEEML